MKFDVIIPLKTDLVPLAIDATIPSILLNISFNKIYIVTKKTNFKELNAAFQDKITCLDEDKISEKLTLDSIKNYFKKRKSNPNRAGWYFQQFIKLNISKLDFITNLYLIWDADAVALKPITFLTKENKVYLERNREYHKPYFDIMEKLIGLKKQTDYSFIAEYLLFNKEIVNAIINKISKDKEWWYTVLDNIDSDNLEKSGFSEYEIYGNYIYKHHQGSFEIRNLNKSRKGVKLLGKKPTINGLKQLSIVFDYMSFEQFHKKYKPLPFRFIMIIFTISFGLLKKLSNR